GQARERQSSVKAFNYKGHKFTKDFEPRKNPGPSSAFVSFVVQFFCPPSGESKPGVVRFSGKLLIVTGVENFSAHRVKSLPMLSPLSFFKTAGRGAAVAATASFPTDLLSWAEPPRAPQPGGPILLNSNENAYGPFPSVLALENPFLDVNRYPDRGYDGLI